MLAHTAPLWPLEPPVAAIVLAGLLYAIGWRRRASRRSGARTEAAFFAAGLGALLLALTPPLASLDHELFWAHMTQHVLLLAVAPPLLLLGRPWATLGRAFPPRLRRAAAHGVLRLGSRAWVRAAWTRVTAPATALVLFAGALAVWHFPWLYDATLRFSVVHVLEHAVFFASGLLLWSQLVDSPPLRSRLGYPARALHATLAMGAGWLLAIVLALGSEPLYQGYARLTSRPGGISALADQQLGAGIMWVPGSIPFAAAILLFAYRWLDESTQERPHAARPAGGR